MRLPKLASELIDTFNDFTGRHPASLARILERRKGILPKMPPPETCISAATLVSWHELGHWSCFNWPRRGSGELAGWRQEGSNYRNFNVHRPEYSEISSLDVTEQWHCDISQVHGFAASKSRLKSFQSTDHMVEANSREMISEISESKLSANLAHDEIRLIHRDKSDYFMTASWDERLFLMNSGGSHHFAAAKYIAKRLPKQVRLTGRLHRFRLNKSAIDSLQNDYHMFLVGSETDCWHDFFEALKAFRATWLWHEMPPPFKKVRAVLLPRVEQRSHRVALVLRKKGATDLGAHLSQISQL